MNLDNTVVYLQKIATLARESQTQGHIIGYPRYENEVYVLNDLHADDLEAASTKILDLLDRVAEAERRIVRLKNREQKAFGKLREAKAALQRVRELHAKHENTIHTRPEWVCAHRHCVDDSMDQNAWPCPTIRALEGDE